MVPEIVTVASIFTQIINRDIPAYIIAENDDFIAFLDAFPLKEGHTLVVPKVEVNKAFDLSNDYLSQWMIFAKPIAQAIEKNFDCNRCGLSIVGIEVPHAHMHLVPISTADDINFTRPKIEVSPERQKMIQDMLISTL